VANLPLARPGLNGEVVPGADIPVTLLHYLVGADEEG
jgi:hypothetical protein